MLQNLSCARLSLGRRAGGWMAAFGIMAASAGCSAPSDPASADDPVAWAATSPPAKRLGVASWRMTTLGDGADWEALDAQSAVIRKLTLRYIGGRARIERIYPAGNAVEVAFGAVPTSALADGADIADALAASAWDLSDALTAEPPLEPAAPLSSRLFPRDANLVAPGGAALIRPSVTPLICSRLQFLPQVASALTGDVTGSTAPASASVSTRDVPTDTGGTEGCRVALGGCPKGYATVRDRKGTTCIDAGEAPEDPYGNFLIDSLSGALAGIVTRSAGGLVGLLPQARKWFGVGVGEVSLGSARAAVARSAVGRATTAKLLPPVLLSTQVEDCALSTVGGLLGTTRSEVSALGKSLGLGSGATMSELARAMFKMGLVKSKVPEFLDTYEEVVAYMAKQPAGTRFAIGGIETTTNTGHYMAAENFSNAAGHIIDYQTGKFGADALQQRIGTTAHNVAFKDLTVFGVFVVKPR